MATVRRAKPRDAGDVLRLLEELGRPPVADDSGQQRAVYLDHLVADDGAVFVAEEVGGVAGVASLWIPPRLNWTTPEGWVPDLYVAERYRRWGLARALLDACVREAKRRGCLPKQSKPPGEGWPSLGGLLESGHQREAVHRLYERYGFVHGGRTYGLPLP